MSKITKKAINSVMDIYKAGKSDIILKITNPSNESEVLLEATVKAELTIPEKGIFVDRVVNACFDVDGDFMPQYLDPVFAISLLQMTTNIPVFETTIMPTMTNGEKVDHSEKIIDVEKTYELCKAINLVANVKDVSYQQLVKGLREMVNDKLEYRKQMQFSQERQILTKAREEIENGVAMLIATSKQLMDTLSQVGTAADMTEALKNMNYSELVSTVLSAT